MNKFVALALLSAFGVTADAQLARLPPSSISDGISLVPGSSAPSLSVWEGSSLWNYRTDSGNVFSMPAADESDALGNTWSGHGPTISGLGDSGGFLQLVFLGSSNLAASAFGYAYTNDTAAAGAYTFSTFAGPCLPAKLNFGDFVVLPFAAGEFNSFNLWYCDGVNFYGLFDALSNAPGTAAGRVTWTQSPILIPTLSVSSAPGASPIGVPTWIVNVREGADDFRFAVQSYSAVSTPSTPVPEPATFGLWGAGCLFVFAICRLPRRALA